MHRWFDGKVDDSMNYMSMCGLMDQWSDGLMDRQTQTDRETDADRQRHRQTQTDRRMDGRTDR